MRDYLLLATVFGLLPFCFARPYVGILVWSWIGYMNPHRLTWGVAYNFPVAEVVGIATLLGFAFTVVREGRLPSLPLDRETILLLLLWSMFTISTFFAFDPDRAWAEWQKVSKILLMTFMTLLLINDRRKLRYLFMVIALSIGFYGLKGGIFSVIVGREWMVLGPDGSSFAGNTGLGLALNMVLPFLFYLSKEEQNRKTKLILQGTFFFSILSVICTYSRGALLGLFVVLLLLFLNLGLGKRVLVGIVLVLVLPVAIAQLPEKWFTRMQTIETYEQDASAMSRIDAWKLAWRIAVDKPLTGGGFEVMENKSLYDIYYPESTHRADVHSVYFEVLSENGFITFGIFVSLLLSSIVSLRKIRRNFKAVSSKQWLYYYSHIVGISLIAYAVNGAFLEVASFDLFYHLVAIVIILKALSTKEMNALSVSTKEMNALNEQEFAILQ